MILSEENILKWNNNKLINPVTNRKIKLNGPTYNKFYIQYKN